MSGQPGDPKPPRTPKPDGVKRPKPPANGGPVEPSTFRANPKRTATARSGDLPPVSKDVGIGPSWWERILFGRISSGQLAVFCRQFAAYLNAGVDIGKALTGLQQQFARTALGPVLGRVVVGVRRGDTLAETVAREPQAFDPLFVGMIKVAEARGGVPETLRLMGRHYEARQSLIRQARSALMYPAVVLFFATCVATFLTVWLLPMLAGFLAEVSERGASLPLPSRALMAAGRFVQTAGWLLIPVVVIGTPLLLLQLYKTRGGKRGIDRVLLTVPVFGTLMRKLDTTRFARTLGALLDAGVDVGASLDLTSDVLRLEPFRRAVRESRTLVMHGGTLSDALDRSRQFGPDVIAVIDSGEETGKLPESLNHLADDYEEQVAYTVRNLGQLVQPLLMILMGGLVLFIILAVFLPYISLLTNLAR